MDYGICEGPGTNKATDTKGQLKFWGIKSYTCISVVIVCERTHIPSLTHAKHTEKSQPVSVPFLVIACMLIQKYYCVAC